MRKERKPLNHINELLAINNYLPRRKCSTDVLIQEWGLTQFNPHQELLFIFIYLFQDLEKVFFTVKNKL